VNLFEVAADQAQVHIACTGCRLWVHRTTGVSILLRSTMIYMTYEIAGRKCSERVVVVEAGRTVEDGSPFA
jgi:hypothetical protein